MGPYSYCRHVMRSLSHQVAVRVVHLVLAALAAAAAAIRRLLLRVAVAPARARARARARRPLGARPLALRCSSSTCS